MTTGTTSRFICARCGLGVYTWGAKATWKHAASGRTGPSCGKPARVVERAVYEAEMTAIAVSIKAVR